MGVGAKPLTVNELDNVGKSSESEESNTNGLRDLKEFTTIGCYVLAGVHFLPLLMRILRFVHFVMNWVPSLKKSWGMDASS